MARAGARLPVASRLALRDLARHQARSGAALAAISLALAIPALVVIVEAADERREALDVVGRLNDRQLIIRVGGIDIPTVPDRTPAQSAAVETAARQFTASLGAPTVVPLDVAMSPDAELGPAWFGGPDGRNPVALGEVIRNSANEITGIHSLEDFYASPLYLGTPELLRHYGLDPGAFRCRHRRPDLQPRPEPDIPRRERGEVRRGPGGHRAAARAPGHVDAPAPCSTRRQPSAAAGRPHGPAGSSSPPGR